MCLQTHFSAVDQIPRSFNLCKDESPAPLSTIVVVVVVVVGGGGGGIVGAVGVVVVVVVVGGGGGVCVGDWC